MNNKLDNIDKSVNFVAEHVEKNGYTAINIRDGAKTVYNSADTDRAILEYATDMAVLLATAKSMITTRPEFDVVNKYD